MIDPVRSKTVRHANRARTLKLRKIDTVALMFLSLWKHVEYANLLTDEMNVYKDELMVEWLQSLRQEYGEKDFMARFTQIMM